MTVIRREDAISLISKEIWRKPKQDTYVAGLKRAVDIIDKMPPETTLHAVARAYWQKSGQSFLHPNKFCAYECSNCGFTYKDGDKQYNFCPNCGAGMIGKGE